MLLNVVKLKLLSLVLSYDPVTTLGALVYVVVLLSTFNKYKLIISGSTVVAVSNVDVEVNYDSGFLTDLRSTCDSESV
jgi:hypothetical protein